MIKAWNIQLIPFRCYYDYDYVILLTKNSELLNLVVYDTVVNYSRSPIIFFLTKEAWNKVTLMPTLTLQRSCLSNQKQVGPNVSVNNITKPTKKWNDLDGSVGFNISLRHLSVLIFLVEIHKI